MKNTKNHMTYWGDYPERPVVTQRVIDKVQSIFPSPIYRYLAVSLIGYIYYHNLGCRDSLHRWFTFSYSFWETVIGRNNYRTLIDTLKKEKVLEFDEFYLIGCVSKKCRLTSEYRKLDEFFQYIDFKDLLKSKNTGKMRPHRDFHERLFAEIKRRAGLKNNDSEYLEMIKSAAHELELPEDIEEKSDTSEELDANNYDRTKFHIENIKNKSGFFTESQRTGRQYNFVTNMPKWLRQQLTHNGERLIEIDISQCQPTFLASLYQEEDPNDVLERRTYSDFIQSNNIYEYFNKKMFYPIKNDEKQLMKEAFLMPLFGGSHMHGMEIFKKFAAEFPILAARIRYVKRFNNSNLAFFLQEKEARAIIHGVIKNLYEDHIWSICVHDAVICKKEDQERVIREINENVLLIAGVKPKLKIDDYSKYDL